MHADGSSSVSVDARSCSRDNKPQLCLYEWMNTNSMVSVCRRAASTHGPPCYITQSSPTSSCHIYISGPDPGSHFLFPLAGGGASVWFGRFLPISEDKVNYQESEQQKAQCWTTAMLLAQVALQAQQMASITARHMRIFVASLKPNENIFSTIRLISPPALGVFLNI